MDIAAAEFDSLSDDSNSPERKKHVENHRNNVKQMLTTALFSDCVIKCKDGEIRAHKFMLAAQSDVFKYMFIHPLEEQKTSAVEIADYEQVVVQQFLNYIYMGILESNTASLHMEKLLALAHLYNIHGLYRLCAKRLGRKLTVENSIRILQLVRRCSIDGELRMCNNILKENVTEYIKNNIDSIKETEEYQRTSDVDLIKEIVDALSPKRRRIE